MTDSALRAALRIEPYACRVYDGEAFLGWVATYDGPHMDGCRWWADSLTPGGIRFGPFPDAATAADCLVKRREA